MTVYAVHPWYVHRIKTKGLAGCWVYADEDLKGYNRVRKALEPRLTRLLNPREFQANALQLQDELIAWVDCNLSGVDAAAWLLTPLHKNPFRSNFNLHAIWCAILARARITHCGDIFVVTRSRGFLRTLMANPSVADGELRCIGYVGFVVDRLLDIARAFAFLLKESLNLTISATLAKWTFGQEYRTRLRGVAALVDTYVHEGDLSKQGGFANRYLPGLVEFYMQRGVRAAYYPIAYKVRLFSRPEMYRRMKAAPELFAPFELFLRYRDVILSTLVCMMRGFRSSSLIKPTFAGVNLSVLVKSHTFRCAMESILPLVLRRVPAHMRAAGLDPQWFVDWYENQPIDKANVIGFREAGSSCRIIAARLYVPIRNFLSQYSTAGEVERGVAPSENWVCGRELAKQAARYDRKGAYRSVPALRYGHLYKQRAVRAEKDLVVLLTHSVEESLGILHRVALCLSGLMKQFEVIRIKPHPDLDAQTMASYVGAAFPTERVVFDQRMLPDVFSSARVVVSAGTSSALEAVCAGLPVIVVGRSVGFDINPLDGIDSKLWELVYDDDEMARTVDAWSPLHPIPLEERIAIGERIRRDYFEPVSAEGMAGFIPSFGRRGSSRAPDAQSVDQISTGR